MAVVAHYSKTPYTPVVTFIPRIDNKYVFNNNN